MPPLPLCGSVVGRAGGIGARRAAAAQGGESDPPCIVPRAWGRCPALSALIVSPIWGTMAYVRRISPRISWTGAVRGVSSAPFRVALSAWFRLCGKAAPPRSAWLSPPVWQGCSPCVCVPVCLSLVCSLCVSLPLCQGFSVFSWEDLDLRRGECRVWGSARRGCARAESSARGLLCGRWLDVLVLYGSEVVSGVGCAVRAYRASGVGGGPEGPSGVGEPGHSSLPRRTLDCHNGSGPYMKEPRPLGGGERGGSGEAAIRRGSARRGGRPGSFLRGSRGRCTPGSPRPYRRSLSRRRPARCSCGSGPSASSSSW